MCVALAERGHKEVLVDDYSNSSAEALVRVRDLTDVMPAAYDVDIRDRNGLAEVFSRHRFDVVIQFAAKKAVPESTQIPLEYFDINLAGTINVLRAMHRNRPGRLVYSSSCSLYGEATQQPLIESDRPDRRTPTR